MGKGYYTLTKITDWGPYITKLVLPVPGEIEEGKNDYKNSFSVYVERQDKRGEVLLLPKSWFEQDIKEVSKGYIPVTAAYPSDSEGNCVQKGGFLTLEMAYGPIYPLSSAIAMQDGYNNYVKSAYRITQTAELVSGEEKLSGLIYDYPLGNRTPEAEGFLNGTSGYEKEPLNYGYFIPKAAGKRPLIVWLHGAGEGGMDPAIAYTGNKVVRLASDEVQALFGGAYIYAPQCKTFWMDDGCGEISTSGNSRYVEALKAAIDEFVGQHEGIDTDRIYIGGDSNGGFMTMRMMIDYPDYFAAAFPVCEALLSEKISDAQIEELAKKPIWFTHAKNDPVVVPEDFVLPTYRRLIEAGAQDVHFTFWDKICDIHDGFADENGEPYEYFGHAAWIPMLNDDCRVDFDGNPVVYGGREVTLLEWLSQHKKA